MFEPLCELFRGDEAKMGRALQVLERVTREDLAQLALAYQQGNGSQMAALAHKLKSSCMQVGESAAAQALLELELGALTGSSQTADLRFAFLAAKQALEQLLVALTAWLAERQASA